MVCIMAKECKSGEYLGSDYRGENLVSDAETGDDNIYGEAVWTIGELLITSSSSDGAHVICSPMLSDKAHQISSLADRPYIDAW